MENPFSSIAIANNDRQVNCKLQWTTNIKTGVGLSESPIIRGLPQTYDAPSGHFQIKLVFRKIEKRPIAR